MRRAWCATRAARAGLRLDWSAASAPLVHQDPSDTRVRCRPAAWRVGRRRLRMEPRGASAPPIAMLARWLLLACLLPGWILPSGVALPLCGCTWGVGEDACCVLPDESAPLATQDASETLESCCAGESPDEDSRERAADEGCCCSVDSPAHDEPCPPNCGVPAWDNARVAPILARADLPPGRAACVVALTRERLPGPAPGERPGTSSAPLRL